MDSEEFFKTHKEFRSKTGIYVLESPLKFNNKFIYKIGYAYQSLYKRIRDYKTAYGPISFKVHIVMEIPQRIFGSGRTMIALATEKRIHEMLKQSGKAIMVKDDNRLDGEWFYDLETIIDTINTIRIEFLDDITNSEKWEYFENNEKAITRSRTANTPKVEMTVGNSQFNKIQVRALSNRNTPKKLDEAYEYDPNKSRIFLKDIYKVKAKSKTPASNPP